MCALCKICMNVDEFSDECTIWKMRIEKYFPVYFDDEACKTVLYGFCCLSFTL